MGTEEVLAPPSEAGLPGYERAHLSGKGFGRESPLGVFYAPREVNQVLQNRGIEKLIRDMYRKRYSGAEFHVLLTAEPHPGTELLAKVIYRLYGKFPQEPEPTFIFEYTIRVGRNTQNPEISVLAGEADMEAASLYSTAAQEAIDKA